MGRTCILVAVAVAGASGCQLVLGLEDPVGGAPDAATPETVEATVYEVQQGVYEVGTEVTLTDVVITAVDGYGIQQGPFWVAEPDGGAFSGVMIWPGVGTDPPLPGVGRGVRVDVTGVVTEFAGGGDTSGRTQTELAPTETGLHLVFHGAGEVPPAEEVPWEIAGDPELAEAWEGVLVYIEHVRFFDPWEQPTADPLLRETTITGPLTMQSQFGPIDTAAPGDCYARVTGIFDYRVGTDMLMPRDADDLAAMPGACLPEEAGDTACANDQDDDLDGAPDCFDPGCTGAATCP